MGWEYLVVLVVSALVSYALAPKPQNQTPTAGQLDIPTPKPGTPLRVVWGEVWIDDAGISYYGNGSAIPIKKEGGK